MNVLVLIVSVVAVMLPAGGEPEIAKQQNKQAAIEQVQRGAVLYKKGNLDEAVAVWQQAALLDPMLASPHRLMGSVRSQQGKLDEASTHWREAIRLNPKDSLVHYNLGVVFKTKGQTDEAIAAFREAIRLNPEFSGAYINLGIMFDVQSKRDEAVAAYREAIRLNPKFAIAHYNLGATLDDQGKLDEAVAAYREAIRLDPMLPKAHGNLGVALQKQGKQTEAQKHLEIARKLDAPKVEDQIIDLQEQVARNPNDSDLYYDLGRRLAETGKLQEAVPFFRTAIKHKNYQPWYHEALGEALLKLGQEAEAKKEFQIAEDLTKAKKASEHVHEGNALSERGKLNEAIAAYREAIRLNPDFSKAYHNLGMALDKQDKLDEAIAAYREAIRLDPTIASPHNYLAKALGKQGKRAEARKHYKIARGINNRNEIIELRERIKHDSSAPYLYHRLGILLTDEGNFEEAVTSHRTAVKLEPNNQNYRQLLGAALLRLGRQAEADKELKIALELIEAARRK